MRADRDAFDTLTPALDATVPPVARVVSGPELPPPAGRPDRLGSRTGGTERFPYVAPPGPVP